MICKKVLVTGGLGFIGSHLTNRILDMGPEHVYIIDKHGIGSNPDYIDSFNNNVDIFNIDLSDIRSSKLNEIFKQVKFDYIFHCAAETHVDRSITSPLDFVTANVVGTANLLELVRRHCPECRVVHVSTDEVYGSVDVDEDIDTIDYRFTENSPLNPSSPYSSSKASSDLLCLAAAKTYGINISITRCANNYGPHQFTEKLIPTVISKAIKSERIPVYGDGMYTREWLYVDDHVRALIDVAELGESGEIYNIPGDSKVNLWVISDILDMMGKPISLIEHVQDRPAHDRCYSINGHKIKTQLNWHPNVEWSDGLLKTIDYYIDLLT